MLQIKKARASGCRIRVKTRFLSGCIVTKPRRQSLKPRKIPQQSRAEQTVAAILEAAARVLETKGMEGMNTNLVAQRAGVGVGSLYQYFPNKDALIVALSEREGAVFFAEAEGALNEPTGQKALRHLITVCVRQQLRRPALARALDFEENRSVIANELAASKSAFREVIRQILVHEDIPPQTEMEITIDDLVAVIRAIVDAAGERGETDRRGLESRVGRAIFGYMGIVDRQPEKLPRTRKKVTPKSD
ncbi:TetR/AcrR family transcriptional regulator [Caballeronia sp. 15715]|uniref:TetR/AcrR family transcriptional regulator n=2 Tax=unclassified Caballeronia TaxID=2646786 RepID=UPI0039E43782